MPEATSRTVATNCWSNHYDKCSRASAWAANGLMVLFLAALVQGGLRGLEIDCGCFGSASGDEASNLWINVLRNLGLLALGLQLAFAPPGKFSVDAYLLRRNKA